MALLSKLLGVDVFELDRFSKLLEFDEAEGVGLFVDLLSKLFGVGVFELDRFNRLLEFDEVEGEELKLRFCCCRCCCVKLERAWWLTVAVEAIGCCCNSLNSIWST